MASLLVNLLAFAIAAQATAPVTGRIVGRVVDQETGQPVVGVRLFLSRAPALVLGQRPPLPQPGSRPATPSTPPPNPLTQKPLMTETNADGVFEIGGVPQGRWVIQAQKQGYISVPAVSLPEIAIVGGQTVSASEIRLDRGGAITGRVLDARGNPMSGLTILAGQHRRLANGTIQMTWGSGGAKTDDRGEYRLAGLPPGELYVVAQLPPPPPLIAMFASTAPAPAPTRHVATYYPGVVDATIASPVNVARGGTTSAIDFTLQSVPAFQVSGIAVDSSGRPVAGAIVRMAQRSVTLNASVEGGPSDAAGRFRITNVPAGTYGVMAAVPVITRTGNGGTSSSLSFGAAAKPGVAPEVSIQSHIANLRVVVTQP